MLKRIKNVFKKSLVKSYKYKSENGVHYFILSEENAFVDSSRIFKSIREINIYSNVTQIYFKLVKIKPVHVSLLARGLEYKQENLILLIYRCCSSKTILQFKSLFRQQKNISFDFNLKMENDLQVLALFHILHSMDSWGNKVQFIIFRAKNLPWNINFEMKTLEKHKFTLYERNSKRVVANYRSDTFYEEVLSYEYFKNISRLTKQEDKINRYEKNYITHVLFFDMIYYMKTYNILNT